MCRSPKPAAGPFAAVVAVALGLAAGSASAGGDYGLGRPATTEEIAGWDIDVRPDGQGLPEGHGSALEGEEVYLERCAACHGEFGEGAGRYPVLMGGEDTLKSQDPVKTIGSYWPYATTLYDYIYRAMPFGEAQSLTPDEVYALTAYLLYMNDLVAEDDELDAGNLAAIEMPNRDRFVDDTRPDTKLGEPCMIGCKESVEVLFRAKPLQVTPTGGEEQTD